MSDLCDSQPLTHIYMFNSPQYFFGKFGHSGVIVEHLDGTIHLYSFHPRPNEGEAFDEGSVAQIVNPADARDFQSFAKACLTPHEEDTREDNRGILLNNGTKTWNERIRRLIKIGLPQEDAKKVEEFCLEKVANPPRFNVITYSCQHFVRDAFKAGGVVLRSKHFSLDTDPIPNSVYKRATKETTEALSFEKIELGPF